MTVYVDKSLCYNGRITSAHLTQLHAQEYVSCSIYDSIAPETLLARLTSGDIVIVNSVNSTTFDHIHARGVRMLLMSDDGILFEVTTPATSKPVRFSPLKDDAAVIAVSPTKEDKLVRGEIAARYIKQMIDIAIQRESILRCTFLPDLYHSVLQRNEKAVTKALAEALEALVVK